MLRNQRVAKDRYECQCDGVVGTELQQNIKLKCVTQKIYLLKISF